MWQATKGDRKWWLTFLRLNCFKLVQQYNPSFPLLFLESSIFIPRQYDWSWFAFFLWVNRLTGERVRVDQLLSSLTVNLSRLSADTRNNGHLIVVISRIRPVLIALVLIWALEVEQILRAASQLLWPIAALDAFVVEETGWFTLSSARYAPRAFTVKDVALGAMLFLKKAKLIGTARRADWLGYGKGEIREKTLVILRNTLFLW